LVSISAGIASTMENWIKSPADLLDAAGRALYRAKRLGRDRIALSSTEDDGRRAVTRAAGCVFATADWCPMPGGYPERL
jgi:hypothetical protein